MFPIALGVLSGCAAAVAFLAFGSWQWTVLLAAVGICLIVGGAMLSGRHPVVVYLRRFRAIGVRDRFGDAFVGDLVRSFRIIALSDPTTNPVVEHGPQALGCVFSWLLLALPMFLIQLVIPLPVLVSLAAVFLLGTPLASRIQKRIVSSLAKRSTVVIHNVADLDVTEQVAKQWHTFAIRNYLPKRHIETISVVPSLWQDTVLRLVGYADAILVDASELGPGLTWEIATLSGLYPNHLVIIASEITSTQSGDIESAEPMQPEPSLRRILAEHELIVHRSGISPAKFSRQCRRALWTVIDSTNTNNRTAREKANAE
jgi:hypothetical protein